MQRTITIVGGGIAGLTLGIGLRQRKVPVVVYEVGHYPRHRVCGEFISGSGTAVLRHLEIWNHFLSEGPRQATATAFFAGRRCLFRQLLPQPAFCLSRFKLDYLLAELFQQRGGQLLQGSRWKGPPEEGVVFANGREVQPTVEGWRYYGLKVHARGVEMTNDLEMHLTDQGYVGMCGVEDNETNICGLFRRGTQLSHSASAGRVQLAGTGDSVLAARVSQAEWLEDSFCSVAGLSLTPRRAGTRTSLCIGDALTMIAPLTGNGMSMAVESAEVAMDPLAAFSSGRSDWHEAHRLVADGCDQRFARRLRWSAWLQRVIFHASPQPRLLGWVAALPGVWRGLFSLTR